MKESLESIRHARSQKDFLFLNLEDGEYVELVITRAKIGLIAIWFLAIVTTLILILCSITLPDLFPKGGFISFTGNIENIFSLVFIVLFGLILIVALVGTKVHFGNKLFITNLRAIKISTAGLFNNSASVIELSRIEDVGFKQDNFLQNTFGYGTIRLSTVGDETTYNFPFVATPTDEMQTISHLIHLARNKKKSEKQD